MAVTWPKPPEGSWTEHYGIDTIREFREIAPHSAAPKSRLRWS